MDELIPLLGIIFVLGVPSLAAATHFVLRPLVRDIIAAIRSNKQVGDEDIRARLTRLEEAYYRLDEDFTRLAQADRFDRELESGKTVS